MVQYAKQASAREDRIQTVDRSIDILYCLAGAGRPMGLTEISRATELDKATVHRLLKTLAARDLVWRGDPAGRYSLGIGVLRLSAAVGQGPDLRALARPYMRDLVQAAQETVGLGTLVDGQHVYVDQAESPHEIRWVVRIGVPVSLHVGAAPRAVLAFLPELEREATINRAPIEPATHGAPRGATELRDHLDEIRRSGVSLSFGERLPDIAAMAAPIFSHGGWPVGTLAIGGPVARVTAELLDDLRAPLLAATRALSAQLGYDADSGER